MKIKVNFITNHSGSNMDLVVDNPVLLEVLQRYKDLGAFGDNKDLGMSGVTKEIVGFAGKDVLDFHIGFYDPPGWQDWERFGRITKTPAFSFFSGESGSETTRIEICPESLDQVLGYIIDIMNGYNEFPHLYDAELYEQMQAELHLREQEIKEGYRKVLWDTSYYLDGPAIGDPEEAHFSYDPENGEKYEAQYYEGD
jgi:hypothetical protein